MSQAIGGRVHGGAAAAASATSVADIATWTVLGAIIVRRIGAVCATAQTGTAPVLTFDIRPTYGSDTGRKIGAAGVGTVTFPAGGVAVGKGVVIEVREKVYTGQQIVCGVTTGATAGTVLPILEYEVTTENAANQGAAFVSGTVQPGPLLLRESGTPAEDRLTEDEREALAELADKDLSDEEQRQRKAVRAQERQAREAAQPKPPVAVGAETAEEQARRKAWEAYYQQQAPPASAR